MVTLNAVPTHATAGCPSQSAGSKDGIAFNDTHLRTDFFNSIVTSDTFHAIQDTLSFERPSS